MVRALVSLVLVGVALAAPSAEAARPAATPRTPPSLTMKPTKGWKQRGEIHDVTARFDDTYKKAQAGTLRLPRPGRPRTILLVEGVGGKQMPGYFRSVETHLKGRGETVVRADINTVDDLDRNGPRLARQIKALQARGDDVVVVTHSMGGPWLLAAEQHDPSIRAGIKARVLMQPADGGVPGSAMFDNPIARAGFKLMKGGGNLMKDTAPSARRAHKAANPHDLSIPTVVLATTASRGLRGAAFKLMTGGPLALRKRDSDGMVPLWSQLIPGTRAVIKDDMDHGEPAMNLPGKRYDAGPMVEALLSTALKLR